ncbi:MAG: hypothetical protein R3231_07200 [bacterium]|nr:hypothetical protein [bacterium]
MNQAVGGEEVNTMLIDLTVEEIKVLRDTMTAEISELGMEIADTDRQDFREGLKRKKALLLGMVDKLNAIAA